MRETESNQELSLHDWQNTLSGRYANRHPEFRARLSHITKELNANADESQMLDPDMIQQLDSAVHDYVDLEDDLALDRINTLIKHI